MKRLLFYCHHLSGLGHVARTVRIAEAAAETGACECALMVSGAPVRGLAWDSRIRAIELPAVRLDPGGRVVPENGEDGGDRAQLVLDTIRDERPDAVLVDYSPYGLGGELVATLAAARDEGWSTRFLWGLPYAEDVRARPRNPRLRKALDAYHRVLGYSDEGWLDLFTPYAEFGLPEGREYVGVVTGTPAPPTARNGKPPVVLGYCGSGYGGGQLLDLMLEAAAPLARAGEVTLRFVAGVANARDAFQQRAADVPNVEVLGECTVEDAARDADLVVARCGYNSAYTLALTDLPLIFVPLRIAQSATEQYERATSLSRVEGIACVDESSPDAADALHNAIRASLQRGARPRTLPFRTDGAANAARAILREADMSERSPASGRRPDRATGGRSFQEASHQGAQP